MNTRLCYNFHNLLKVIINRDKEHTFFDKFNLKFSYFEVDDVIQPEIILNIGDFQSLNRKKYTIDHKYHIDSGYLFCSESNRRISWKIEIIDLESECTTINISCQTRGVNGLIYPDFFPQNILLKIIEYRLFLKDYYLVHGAAVSKGEDAYVLVGRGGSFKTSICMDLIRNYGYSYLGDDRIIIGDGKVFAFPINANVFGYMKQNMDNENAWGIQHKIKCFYDTQKGKKYPIGVTESAKITKILVINKTNKKDLTVKNLPLTAFGNLLLNNNRLEDFIDIQFLEIYNAPFFRYCLAYANIFPNSSLNVFLNEFGEQLKTILLDKEITLVEIPDRYSSAIADRIQQEMINE